MDCMLLCRRNKEALVTDKDIQYEIPSSFLYGMVYEVSSVTLK